jgi:IMP dehydrogenase
MELGSSLCFDDVLMEPLYSDISTRRDISLETNIATNNRKLILKTPLISSPMDTVSETEMAIKMALCGGLGIIHRYMSVDEQVSQVVKVKRFLQYIIKNPYRVLPDMNLVDIENLIAQYGVSTFCVVDSMESNRLIGILTHRDIENMKYNLGGEFGQRYGYHDSNQNWIDTHPPNKHEILVQNNMTMIGDGISNGLVITITMEGEIETVPETVLQRAKQLMMDRRIEKIPIVSSGSSNSADRKLLGLITLKNIRHWENNKSKACIDANGALCVGAAIGIIGDYMERLEELVKAGVDLICIDVANGFNSNVIDITRDIRAKYPLLPLMVGNVCNWQGYEALAMLDIDCIRVGVGNGSICTTRLETGIGKGQFSAVAECFRFKTVNYKLPHIICDGGSLGKTGNKVKALACGASAIMLGRTLASTEEAPGQIIYRNGRRFKYIRGMASTMANISKQEKVSNGNGTNSNKKIKTDFTAEGVDGEQELSGSVADLIEQINGGLKSGLSYLGCKNITQVHEKNIKNEIRFNIVSSIGMTENGIRVKTY